MTSIKSNPVNYNAISSAHTEMNNSGGFRVAELPQLFFTFAQSEFTSLKDKYTTVIDFLYLQNYLLEETFNPFVWRTFPCEVQTLVLGSDSPMGGDRRKRLGRIFVKEKKTNLTEWIPSRIL
ncbi:unnamed protein product [Allacma fusca]|uniref:Uncharacterized protein n=1 Tax=Allacma fusca TaxID=39272 RepID=A0A8J2PNS7_9HEXA|nr:unnamed protein product [Allacma fusca]